MTFIEVLLYLTILATLWLSPFILTKAFSMIRKLEQRLPEKMTQNVDWIVKMAVKYVEQKSVEENSFQKKCKAVDLIYSLLEAMKLPIPPHALIDTAVEALIWELNQAKIPDEFFDGDKRAINTGPIKPISPPDPGGQTV